MDDDVWVLLVDVRNELDSWRRYARTHGMGAERIDAALVARINSVLDSKRLPSGVTPEGTSPDGCTVEAQPQDTQAVSVGPSNNQ